MSGVFDLDTEGAAALDEEARLNPLDVTQLPPPAWQGTGAALKGTMRPSAAAGRALMMAGSTFAIALDKGAQWGDRIGMSDAERRRREDLGIAPKPLGATDWFFRNVVDDTGTRAVDAWTADPQTMGSAAKAINMVGTVAGSIPQIIATPELFLASSALDPGTEVIRQGGDADTALGVAGVNLAANAIGLKIPNAFGSTLTARVATGAGSNVAVGAAADAASSKILEAGGQEQQAESYDAADPYARGLDLLMGAAFGFKAHVDAPRTMSPSQRDAVLVINNNDHLTRRTMPGEPVSPKAQRASANATTQAIEQLLAGDPVDISATVRAEDFVLRPELQAKPSGSSFSTPNEAAYDRFVVALESGGRADAKASTSSATGLHQFTADTWLTTVRKAAPAWAQGMDDAPLLAQRTDPAKSAEMERALRAENATALQAAGQDASVFNLYAAHHFGAKKGVAFAKAADDTPMEQILTKAQLKANPYLEGKTKGEAVANWTERAGKAGVRMERAAFESPDAIAQRDFVEAAKTFDVPEDIARQLAPSVARDSVTGFYDARVSGIKTDMLTRAQQHVESTGEPAHYVSADLFNLGGLNEHVGNRAEAANVHYREMAQALDTELRAIGADVIPMRTGGDEFGAVVVNADGPAVQAAIDRAQTRIGDYARAQGLADIPHPKRSGEKGVGLHVGVAAIRPDQSVRAILDRADAGVDLSKHKAFPNVARITTEPSRPDAPGGQAGRTAEGTGTPDRGLRQGAAEVGAGRGGQPESQRESGSADQLTESPVEAAQRLADENPDTHVIDGFDADGNPRYRPLTEALADIEAERAQAEADARAFPAAVNCFLRRGGNAS
jgi:GGDEF domain-containing protein